MKKISFTIISLLILMFTACSEVDIPVYPEHELAEISTIELQGVSPDQSISVMTNVMKTGSLLIDKDSQSVTAQISPEADITKVKLILSVSSGARVTPAISGLQDMSQPKTYSVVSANGTVIKEWTITVTQE